MENPYLVDNSIRLKIVLSCPKEAVWNLIGTCEGYVTWFPTSCTGSFEKGKTIHCGWWGSEPDGEHRILEIKKGHYVEMGSGLVRKIREGWHGSCQEKSNRT